MSAKQPPTPPTAQAFAAIKASPPAQADSNNPWTGLWRGKLRGRESSGNEFRQFHDERMNDMAVAVIQKDDGVWIEGNPLTSPLSMLGGESQPVRLKLSSSKPTEATTQQNEQALDGKITSELKLQAELKDGQLRVVIRIRTRGSLPAGHPVNPDDKPMTINYSMDAIATFRRNGPSQPK